MDTKAPPIASPRPGVKQREDRFALGILLMAGAYFCFTMVDSSAKWLVGAGLPVIVVVFIRYCGHFLISLALFLPQDGIGVFRSNAPKIQILRALCLLGSTCFNFLALRHLPLTVTTGIFFATPIVICLLAIPVLGEKVGVRRFSAVLVGFVGVLVIVQPWGASFHWAVFSSLGALLCASFYMILTRVIAGVDDNPTGQIYTSGIATVCLIPFAIGEWTSPATTLDYAVAVAIGLFGGIGHSMVTIAHRFAPASTLAPWVYIQVIYVAVISWVVFAQPPGVWTLVGTAIIIGSGLYIWLRERQLRHKA